ncbi:MAG: S-methyl-5'-thioinosine phosphorylase [Gammaproteobacteria bacterium]|nr:S-methyl-5'-thioinosine phosphorylase [Gammaproteobacteria bacterium]
MSWSGIIGGTGALTLTPRAGNDSDRPQHTPYGETSSPLLTWQTGATQICFIARHGLDGSIPPHLVNYRANIWALHEAAPDCVIGLNAVGGIADWASPARLVFPDQLVDYTWGREHTFSDGRMQPLQHIEFTHPFGREIHRRLVEVAGGLSLDFHPGGVYGVTQGPRLETAAEIDRMQRDGCDIVGMTALPEAALAGEVSLDYAICAVVVNWAAGRAPEGAGIHDEIRRYVDAGMSQVIRLLEAL